MYVATPLTSWQKGMVQMRFTNRFSVEKAGRTNFFAITYLHIMFNDNSFDEMLPHPPW